MATIIENESGQRRIIKLSTDDIFSIIQEYQTYTKGITNYKDIRQVLKKKFIYIPAD